MQVCHPACRLAFFATQVAEPAMAVSCKYDKQLSLKKQELQKFSSENMAARRQLLVTAAAGSRSFAPASGNSRRKVVPLPVSVTKSIAPL